MSFPPQPVITSDNLVVNIDTVIYYTVIDSKRAVYEIANFIQGIEQLTVTTLRNVIGSLDLEQTLTSRDQINGQLRGVLDEATGRPDERYVAALIQNVQEGALSSAIADAMGQLRRLDPNAPGYADASRAASARLFQLQTQLNALREAGLR